MKSLYLIKPYLYENRLLIALGLICLVAVDILQLFIPRILKLAVDDLTSLQAERAGLLKYALAIVGFSILIGLFRYGWRRCLIGLSRRVEEGLRNRLFAHIQTLGASYFDKTSSGDLMAHATNDIQHVRMATGMGLVALTDAIVLGAAAIGFMAYIHTGLTLLVLIPMPLIVFCTTFFSRRMHRLYQRVQETFSDLTETVREQFAGIRIIKAYVREETEMLRLSKLSGRYIKENMALARVIRSFFPLMLFFANLSLVIVLYLGGRQTVFFVITPGDFVAFISYLGLLTWPMMALGWVTNLIQRGGASLDRIDKIIKTRPAIIDGNGTKQINSKSESIFFENVSFAYHLNGSEKQIRPVLSDIRFRVEPGEMIGIVGPPGCGKSTLLSLLPRLYDVSSGSILIGGADIRGMRVDKLRSRISFMPQESFLFADTIRSNIVLGGPLISESRFFDAIEKAYLKEAISKFPKGVDSLVGEKGVILSGGQKQRVALARSLLKEASILILDDPISQVDMATGN
ncbi:MAG: multidrug ABC transporter permease, partial [Deltaproteobacteria bacterium RBG_13_49_15]